MREFREIRKEERELLTRKIAEIEKEHGFKCKLVEGSASDEGNGVTIFTYRMYHYDRPVSYILGIYNGAVYDSVKMGLDEERKQWGYKLTGRN